MFPTLLMVLFAIVNAGVGCGSDNSAEGDDDTSSADTDIDTDTDSDTDTDTDTNTGTGTDTDTGPFFDCDDLPQEPISTTELNLPRGYHDVAFDPEGRIVGSDGSTIMKVTSDDVLDDIVPGIGWVEGMDYLPNGDLVVAEDMAGRLLRIDPEGVSTPFANDIYAYGLIVGPYGRVFVANNSAVYRIDPDTSDIDVYVDHNMIDFQPRVLNFSPDYSRLYIGTHDGYGEIYYMELEADLDPISEPFLLATGVGGAWQDGMGVDACGNIYVPVYDNHTLYRISPEGEVEVFYAWPSLTPYGHGIKWGTGQDGWSATALYMPQPYDGNTVIELEIGVPSRAILDDD